MGLLSKITDLFGGSLVETVVNTIEKYLPPDMSPQEKAQLTLDLERLAFEKQKQADQVATDAEARLTERASLLEGTATDLRAVPIIGPILLLLRGVQRPVWGFAALYMDIMWFSGSWHSLSAQQESALYVVNLLVLGFLFGERAVANLAPVIAEMMSRRQPK